MNAEKPETETVDATAIRTLLEHWADAVRRHDLAAILAHHTPDMMMFDLPPPLQCRGLEAYALTWEPFFQNHELGGAFDIRELTITAGEDVGLAVAVIWCGPVPSPASGEERGFPFRLTVGLRKSEGSWQILHEHHSIPATD